MKNIGRLWILIPILVLVNESCSQKRTYLTDQEKAWNPYKNGQVLIFGTASGRTDTLKVTRVEDYQFPDGIGAPQNERLRVLFRVRQPSISKKPVELRFLYISSKIEQYESEIDFEYYIGDGVFWGRGYPIHELEEYKESYLETSNRTYNDVIKVTDNSNQILENNDIINIFWSKSVGYVKCETKDGTVWELINIIESQK